MKTSNDILLKVWEEESQFWQRYSLGPSSTNNSFSQIPHTGQANAVPSSIYTTVPATRKRNSMKILICEVKH
jgi:hypothetical protein